MPSTSSGSRPCARITPSRRVVSSAAGRSLVQRDRIHHEPVLGIGQDAAHHLLGALVHLVLGFFDSPWLAGRQRSAGPRDPASLTTRAGDDDHGHRGVAHDLGGPGAQEHAGDRAQGARSDDQHIAVVPVDVLERLSPGGADPDHGLEVARDVWQLADLGEDLLGRLSHLAEPVGQDGVLAVRSEPCRVGRPVPHREGREPQRGAHSGSHGGRCDHEVVSGLRPAIGRGDPPDLRVGLGAESTGARAIGRGELWRSRTVTLPSATCPKTPADDDPRTMSSAPCASASSRTPVGAERAWWRTNVAVTSAGRLERADARAWSAWLSRSAWYSASTFAMLGNHGLGTTEQTTRSWPDDRASIAARWRAAFPRSSGA